MIIKKNCIVFYSESSRDWLDKISEIINVTKRIKLDEKETVETVNEKIKNNFCIGDYYKSNDQLFKNPEFLPSSNWYFDFGIIFLSIPKKINIKELFFKNNFSPFLPMIIEINEKDKLDKLGQKIENFDNTMKEQNIMNHLKGIYLYKFDSDDPPMNKYLDSMYKFSNFFIKIHNECNSKNGCKIENIKQQYCKFYCEDLSSEDVKDVFGKIKSIKNIFGFFQLHNENDFISNLEYLFKYNIIINASSIMNGKKGQKLKSGDFNISDIRKIEWYYKLLENEREEIRSEIVNKKFITLE